MAERTNFIMIGFLRGKIAFRNDPYIYVDVQGVGYKVLATRDVLSAGSSPEKELLIYTYTHVREDTLELFGFLHAEDLKLFEYFISISGIGPKTAIQIFSAGSRKEIVEAIIGGNVNFFTSVPRLGKKNAQKIILELKSKFGKGGDELAFIDSASADDELIVALQSMGFGMPEIISVLKSLPEGKTEIKLKAALKLLARG
jgi:Holliday junction DNA helicase RuvA